MNPYRFFNGEAVNPFNSAEQPTAAMFWDYESIFEATFDSMRRDKFDAFEKWLGELLTVTLPGKHEENEPGDFVRLYWRTPVSK